MWEPFECPSTRLVVEIGCGTGTHPLDLARNLVDTTVVAIEHTHERFNKFARRLEREGRPANLLPVHANAISWITHSLRPSSVDDFYLLYPNPYPKRRDLNKRWYAMPFFSRLLETLRPGGHVNLATNLPWYAAEARHFLTHAWGMRISVDREIRASDLAQGFRPRTAFETKYLARGESCFELRAMKL